MQLTIHATVDHKDGQQVPLLGNPGDHQLAGDFLVYKIERGPMQMQIVISSVVELNQGEVENTADWVLGSLGFAG